MTWARPPAAGGRVSSGEAHLAVEDRAVLDFLRGDYSAAAESAVPCDGPHRTNPPVGDRALAAGGEVMYLQAAACCYAVVRYDAASGRVVRRVVGLFGDVDEAEGYARDNRFGRYDVVPAAAVIPRTP